MKLLEKILVATDFRESSGKIVERAISVGEMFKSKIILVHVLPSSLKNEKAGELLHSVALKELNKIQAHLKSRGLVTQESVIEYGNYSDKIAEVAENVNANIVLVASGEKSSNDAFPLGTTASALIRKSNKPVWVFKLGSAERIERILCPVDFSEESERALKNAIIMARRLEAELVVFSAYEVVYTGSLGFEVSVSETDAESRNRYEKAFDVFLSKFELTGLNWKKEMQNGDAAEEILKAIRTHKSNLVIMGTTGKNALSRFVLGSVAEKVTREVPCSFITIKTEGFLKLELETRVRDIETHYQDANQLLMDGFLDESILMYERCLSINDMHIPSIHGLAKVYERLGDTKNAEKYNHLATDLMSRLWDRKIEDEIRKHPL